MKTARRWTCSLLGFCLWGLIGSLSIVESAAAHATEAGSDSIQFTYDLLLAGGYVIDPAHDVDGVFDVQGLYVTPGLIDPHTHYDMEMFWDPGLDPLPNYGMTTAIMGNCGLGLAPVRDDVRDGLADLMCFIEELPFALAEQSVPWNWSTWADYHAVASQTPTTVTLFAYTAHNALRAFVMGREAWERPANTTERERIASLLDEALRHGSLGLSSNWFDTDRNRELVPSRLADDAELDALMNVLARHPHAPDLLRRRRALPAQPQRSDRALGQLAPERRRTAHYRRLARGDTRRHL